MFLHPRPGPVGASPVVDDDPTYVGPLADRLDERLGPTEVVTAETADEGLDLLDDHDVDCVVAAYALPDRTGVAFLDAVRDAFPDLPFVLFPAEGSEAVAAGVTDYLPNPAGEHRHDALADRITGTVSAHRSRQARLARAKELQLYERVFAKMQEGACLYDTDGRFQIVNDFLADFYGTTREALEGRRSKLVDTIREQGDDDPFRALLDGERESVRGEAAFDLPDRGEVIVNYRLTPLRIASEVEGVIAVARDVTERRARERQLERAREESQELIDGMNDTAWVIDPEEGFLAVNDAAVEKMGYSRRELLSMDPHDIDAGLSDEKISSLIENMPEDGRQVFETAHRTKDGEVIPVKISSSLITYRGETAILSVARDITERKQYEQRFERQRDELEVLNQVLRHDIRNDLQLVTAYAGILRDHVDEAGTEHLTTVRERANHAVELTQTARDTAEVMQSRDADNEPVDVRPVLEEEVDDLRNRYPDADIAVPSALPSVAIRADEMLPSVFRNLLTNTVQHNVPEITVTATEHADRVTVRVADNGPGVPDAQKEDIFGEGETGLDSPGSGLGLYLVDTLVGKYGGEVRVGDNEPTGAVFVVEFPKAT
jgi:PAS domain S-box-containing protein